MDIVDLREFYRSPLGELAADLIAAPLKNLIRTSDNDTVMGLGFAPPYLERLIPSERRQLAFMLARQGVIHWPLEERASSALVDEFDLPLLESTVDVAIIVHALELTDSPIELLKELWRVLSPQGKVYVVVPNRRGLWSGSESTPFGYGQPFSRSQLSSLMKEAQFTVTQWHHALFVPPLEWKASLKSGPALEKLFRHTAKSFSGAIVVEATKQVYAFSSGKRARRLVPRLNPALLPAPARKEQPLP